MFTLPAEVADIAFHNKATVYDLLFKAASETMLTIAAEPDDFRPPCPCCGGRMIVIEMFERWRQPRGPPDASAANRENRP